MILRRPFSMNRVRVFGIYHGSSHDFPQLMFGQKAESRLFLVSPDLAVPLGVQNLMQRSSVDGIAFMDFIQGVSMIML